MDALTLIIGHRGTGKSSLLKRLPGAVDLDDEIARVAGESISSLFARGEEAFREIERVALARLMQSSPRPRVVAPGAGFTGPLPEDARVVWLRRESDSAGRSFLNRPRLNPELSPRDEYLARLQEREVRFRNWTTEELTLPEGYEGGLEAFLSESDDWHIPFDLTLLPMNFRRWEEFISRRLAWGIRRFELREDLLSPEQIARARAAIPADRLLYSVRLSESHPPEDLAFDWPLELGEPPARAHVVSLHQRETDFHATLKRFEGVNALCKLAVEVRGFNELEAGHRWWLESPRTRSFLPRSPSGRWRWYRQLFGPRMGLHYVREGEGSGLDQPLIWQSLLVPELRESFAAVLGHPVGHSRSPLEQNAYFSAKNMPFVAIDVDEDEFESAWPVLKRMGLTHAAVTAPLKAQAARLATDPNQDVQELSAANTLLVKGERIYAANTDWQALRDWKRDLTDAKEVWLWGRGAMRSAVERVWPHARAISAREGDVPEGVTPELLIWATGRGRSFVWPKVRPQLVLDLNYGDDSPGLEWAVRENLPYQSGLKMFKLQARYQRLFWDSNAL